MAISRKGIHMEQTKTKLCNFLQSFLIKKSEAFASLNVLLLKSDSIRHMLFL